MIFPEGYANIQRRREGELLKKGTAFEVIRRLLALNEDSRRVIDVIVLSQNSPDLSLRAFNSFELRLSKFLTFVRVLSVIGQAVPPLSSPLTKSVPADSVSV